ncbi:hypothetical protein BJ742DRAFT_669259, partial [Cladochytrium replicatum]
HPLKSKARGQTILNLPILIFTDDTCGNRSKRWYLHEQWYMALVGLPFEDLQKRSNIHLLSTSN